MSQKRKFLIFHIEAIAREAILTEAQSHAYRKAAHPKAAQAKLKRVRAIQGNDQVRRDGLPNLVGRLRERSQMEDDISRMIRLLIGTQRYRSLYPDGIDHLDGMSKIIARTHMPQIKIPEKDLQFVERLNDLTLKAFQFWMIRGLDQTPWPPAGELAYRLGDGGTQLWKKLVVHAESILMEAILTRDQGESCLAQVWKGAGAEALSEPALASQLHLSRDQQYEIALIIQNKRFIEGEHAQALLSILGLLSSNPELQELARQMAADAGDSLTMTGRMIWGTLTTAQTRQLRKILTVPLNSPKAATLKK